MPNSSLVHHEDAELAKRCACYNCLRFLASINEQEYRDAFRQACIMNGMRRRLIIEEAPELHGLSYWLDLLPDQGPTVHEHADGPGLSFDAVLALVAPFWVAPAPFGGS